MVAVVSHTTEPFTHMHGIWCVVAFALSFFRHLFERKKKRFNLLTADPLRSEHPPKHVVDLDWTGGR